MQNDCVLQFQQQQTCRLWKTFPKVFLTLAPETTCRALRTHDDYLIAHSFIMGCWLLCKSALRSDKKNNNNKTTGHCWENWVISTTYLHIPFRPWRFHEKWNASPLPVVQHHFWHSGQIRFSALCDITDALLHTTTLIRGLFFQLSHCRQNSRLREGAGAICRGITLVRNYFSTPVNGAQLEVPVVAKGKVCP